MRAAVVFQSPLRAKTMRGLCLWARTRAALRLREQLAAPSNIHERDGKTVKDSVGPGIQKERRRRVSSQRLMGLICINSELRLFLRDNVCVCEVGRGELQSSFCHQWCFCSVQSAAAAQFNITEGYWPALQYCTAAGSMLFILASVYAERHECLLMGKSHPKIQDRSPVVLFIEFVESGHIYFNYHAHVSEW